MRAYMAAYWVVMGSNDAIRLSQGTSADPSASASAVPTVSASGSVGTSARSIAGIMASLVRRSSFVSIRILRACSGVGPLVGDAAEEDLADDLALVGPEPQRGDIVVRGEHGWGGIGHGGDAIGHGVNGMLFASDGSWPRRGGRAAR